MKTFKILKTYMLYIIIAVLAVLLICLYISNRKQKYELLSYKKEKVNIEKEIQTEAKIIKRKVDEKGAETVLFDIQNNVVPAGMKHTEIPAKTKGLIDTTAMALDIRNKQITQILSVNASLTDENLKLRKELDKVTQRPFYTYKSKDLNLKFTPPNETDTVGYADFSANVNIKATQYYKKKWFLGAKHSMLAISSPDPRFKINGADFLEIEQKQPTLGLRVQGAANYDIRAKKLGIGPAARINIGRATIYGNYLYYPGQWTPNVGLVYDVLRF